MNLVHPVRDGTQTTWSFLAIFDPSQLPHRGFTWFLQRTHPPPIENQEAYLKKVGIYRQAVYVIKEHWLSSLFAIFYTRNTV